MIYLFSIFILLSNTSALAASCCGGSFAAPALILGDEKLQLTSSYSYGSVTDEALASGKWLRRDDSNRTQTLKLDAATLISDTWQIGGSIPIISKTADQKTAHTGIGDLTFNLAHETFPERTYHAYRPRGVSFLSITMPTSPSIYDDQQSATEIRGRGFYSLAAGVALIKTWRVWDVNYTGELHKSFNRTIRNSNQDTEIRPNWGTTHAINMGWNKGSLRLGTGLAYLFEDRIESQGAISASGSEQKNITWLASASYMFNLESALSLTYSDQSLFGAPQNSSLTRTLAISYQHRWLR